MTILNHTAHKILDAAENYTQTLGFNAFSYKDLGKEVGIKTSSIHYYFPTKNDLAFAMIERFVERFHTLLDHLKATLQPGLKQLEALGDIYLNVLKNGKFCICGMLASDLATLPENTNSKLQEFFKLNELWIANAITHAKEQGEFRNSVNAKNAASLFLAVLEGGMLIARTQKHTGYLEATLKEAIHQMRV